MNDILDDLASVGFPVGSVDELRRSGLNYGAAVPALIRELAREQDPRKKEWIIRALSVPWARPVAIDPLIREFRTLPWDDSQDNDHTRWAIGNVRNPVGRFILRGIRGARSRQKIWPIEADDRSGLREVQTYR